MTQWWINRAGGTGTRITYASMQPNSETTEGPYDDATDPEVAAFMAKPIPVTAAQLQSAGFTAAQANAIMLVVGIPSVPTGSTGPTGPAANAR